MISKIGKKYLSWIFALCFLFGLVSPAHAQNSMKAAIQSVLSIPVEGKPAYDVQVIVSVIDESGSPVLGLATDNFVLSEDSQTVEIKSAQPATEMPIHVVLVMDTSGSMSGAMDPARQAATNFISRLGSKDQAALISFNDRVSVAQGFTEQKTSVSDAVNGIYSVANAGTCLYDAAFQAVQTASTMPSGRRAVLLLTDGKDETRQGGVCSIHNEEDVIKLATSEGIGVPVYTIGLGSNINDLTLNRIASLSGGSYTFASDSSKLEEMFGRLSEQLNAQYLIKYVSTGTPGKHTLSLDVKNNSFSSQTTHEFILPALPTVIAITSPADEELVSGNVTISASVLSQGEPIARVVFTANGENIGEDFSVPYETVWDGSDNPSLMDVELSAIAINQDGAELSRSVVKVLTNVIENGEAQKPDTFSAQQPPKISSTGICGPSTSSSTCTLYVAGGGVIFLGLLIGGVFLVSRNSKKQKPANKVKHDNHLPGEDMTIDGLVTTIPGCDVKATLTILTSDDPGMIGQVLNIQNFPVNLGRSATNDLVFPKDSPVSRQHAIIELTGKSFLIRELISYEGGSSKRPAYGTYVNEKIVGENGVILHSGDEIRLGSRLRLKFNSSSFDGSNQPCDDLTFDGFQTNNVDDSTLDA